MTTSCESDSRTHRRVTVIGRESGGGPLNGVSSGIALKTNRGGGFAVNSSDRLASADPGHRANFSTEKPAVALRFGRLSHSREEPMYCHGRREFSAELVWRSVLLGLVVSLALLGCD